MGSSALPPLHSVRYHGIFAPNSKARARVLPGSADAPEPIPSPPSSRPKAIPGTRTYRLPWADLLKKVFAVDVLACPDCGGRLQIIAFIADSVCDRLVHTAHKVKLSGESLRKGIRCTDPVWRERHGVGKLLAWNRIASERRRRCGQSADACSSVGIGRGGGTVSGPISAASWAWSRRERVRAQYLGASSR